MLSSVITEKFLFSPFNSVFMAKLRNHPTSHMLRAEFLTALKEFDPNSLLDKELVLFYLEECAVNVVGVKKPCVDVHLMANHYLNRQKNVTEDVK